MTHVSGAAARQLPAPADQPEGGARGNIPLSASSAAAVARHAPGPNGLQGAKVATGPGSTSAVPEAPLPILARSVDATTPPRNPTTLQLPPVPAPVQAQTTEGGFAETFGKRSYVKDGANAKLVEIVRAAVAKSPELAGTELAAAAEAGHMGPRAVRALQRHLESKGYSVGETGIDGKYGPRTHQAMADFLADRPPATPTAPSPEQEGPPAGLAPDLPGATVGTPATGEEEGIAAAEPTGGGRVAPRNASSYHISQYPGATNTRETTRRNGNCGPTSTLMALKAFGYVNPTPAQVNGAIDQIRARGGSTREERVGRGSGTAIGELARAARSYGASAQAKSGQRLADVQRDLAAGKKVVVLVKPSAYSRSRSGGHYVLVTGMQNGKVVVNDPAQQSGGRVIDARSFERAMRIKGGQTVAIQ